MTIAVVALCSTILLLGAGFHLYWGLGRGVGAGVALPQREDGTPAIKETAFGAMAVGLILVLVLLLVLGFIGAVRLPLAQPLLKAGIILWAIVFSARALSWSRYFGLFKRVRTTRFASYDSWFYSPSCLLLGLGLFYLALSQTAE
ncbi:DUF3995 domain-containing protein [Mesorhizobium sp. L2C066B000]|uniref:DUF3995 domain-containing protein n=1 Tax=Mesorhizobium sp. L2C066B000 TaxID=1287105 RepID=UPI0003D03B0D|nr:DUF3995 domain-containing protein [Mesorhizobium sp. L2C066B000]ESZ42738.1 hypothetical protein X732_08810 [Mesorhizobium sp. L2C066B000]